MATTFRTANLHDIHAVYGAICDKVSRKDLSAWTSDVPFLVLQYIKQGLCGVLEDASGIAVIVMGRPVAKIEDGSSDRFSVDWRGTILWVECILSRDGLRRVWREAIAHLTSRGCAFTKVAWCRMKRGTTPFIFDFETVNARFA